MMRELGVHVETCTNEASAAAMLGASINYPLRGAVTWKSIVGTNVAADALSNLASPGVIGGAMIIVGEDYGEGASVIQERSYAYAMKSSMWLLDPRPDLPTIVRMVEKGFELSESEPRAGDARAAHSRLPRHRLVHGEEQPQGRVLRRQPHDRAGQVQLQPAGASARHLSCRRSSRSSSACRQRSPSSREHKLNELFPGDLDDIGIIVHGRADHQRAARAGAARPRRRLRHDARADADASTSSIRWCRKRSRASAPASARC